MSSYEVVVIGAGQAGIEAALASARMGRKTLCVTLRLDRIGHLPCNCSIGGPAKGHIAREVDALGGQMAVTTDHTLTHMRRVGTGKGPAVQTLRAQVCKVLYPQVMGEVLRNQPNLCLIEGVAEEILAESGTVAGVRILPAGSSEPLVISAGSVVVTTGTFLNGVCHEGQNQTVAAREGDASVHGLSHSLASFGVRLRRFKTGTTPRVRKSSINLGKTEVMESEPDAGALSFLHDAPMPLRPMLPTWQTRTNPSTHRILADHLHLSAMYSGQIEGVGPRYCPSVEDKIMRFADKDSHPIFLEQEEWDGESIYVQGFSTSMPAEVQLTALRTIEGLEEAQMIRPGYAVEYDMADPTQLHSTLMSRQLRGLFLAGQLNGTSGYEEAAGQGIVAGINAARLARGEPEVEFPRTQSFIGVMIDDLVTKGVEDPYRMLTARAEYRLLLRHDNADQRLTPLAIDLGLATREREERFTKKWVKVEEAIKQLKAAFVAPNDEPHLREFDQSPVVKKMSMFEFLRRPRFDVDDAIKLSELLGQPLDCQQWTKEIKEQVELAGKFEGYIQIQARQAEQHEKLLSLRIPNEFDWKVVRGLSYESLEKFQRQQPETVGAASQIPGVRPSDVALLIGFLRSRPQRTGTSDP